MLFERPVYCRWNKECKLIQFRTGPSATQARAIREGRALRLGAPPVAGSNADASRTYEANTNASRSFRISRKTIFTGPTYDASTKNGIATTCDGGGPAITTNTRRTCNLSRITNWTTRRGRAGGVDAKGV